MRRLWKDLSQRTAMDMAQVSIIAPDIYPSPPALLLLVALDLGIRQCEQPEWSSGIGPGTRMEGGVMVEIVGRGDSRHYDQQEGQQDGRHRRRRRSCPDRVC